MATKSWINGIVYWHTYASLSLNEWIYWMVSEIQCTKNNVTWTSAYNSHISGLKDQLQNATLIFMHDKWIHNRSNFHTLVFLKAFFKDVYIYIITQHTYQKHCPLRNKLCLCNKDYSGSWVKIYIMYIYITKLKTHTFWNLRGLHSIIVYLFITHVIILERFSMIHFNMSTYYKYLLSTHTYLSLSTSSECTILHHESLGRPLEPQTNSNTKMHWLVLQYGLAIIYIFLWDVIPHPCHNFTLWYG